jgi:hypothetical protein
MKKYINIKKIVALSSLTLILSCSESFLDRQPIGVFTEEALTTKTGVEGVLIGAYTGLNGAMYGAGSSNGADVNSFSNWVYGGITSDDAQKGANLGGSRSNIERYESAPDNTKLDDRWRFCYDGVSRCNDVLRIMSKIPDLTPAEVKSISGQARALRALYYFQGTVVFGKLPWIDEKTTDYKQKNERLLWKEIEDDLKYAYDNLPETYSEVGRINKWAAGSILAKILIFQKKWQEANTLLDVVIQTGRTTKGIKYALMPNYHDNFRIATQGSNSDSEGIIDAQYSANDNSQGYNGGLGDNLNFPHGGLPSQPGACCGYYQPSQDLVNAFQTNDLGLPLLADHNVSEVKNDQGIESAAPFVPHTGPLDPRIDHTLGRRGIPYHDWGLNPGKAWVRDQNYAGPFIPKKNVYYKSDEAASLVDPDRRTSALNHRFLRFADVLLLGAEAAIELNQLEKARGYVNQIRKRAGNSSGFIKMPDGTAAANYRVGTYDTPWTVKADAHTAMRFERRIELAMEGHRFFDLVRWGFAKDVLNKYLAYEVKKRSNLAGASFKDHNIVFPVPQRQIDATKLADGTPTLTQNTGY